VVSRRGPLYCTGARNPGPCQRWPGPFLAANPKRCYPCSVGFLWLLPFDSGYPEHSARVSGNA
jgi:hypothetical protein